MWWIPKWWTYKILFDFLTNPGVAGRQKWSLHFGTLDDFVTFITHLREVEAYLYPVREATNQSCKGKLEEWDLTPPPGSETEEE